MHLAPTTLIAFDSTDELKSNLHTASDLYCELIRNLFDPESCVFETKYITTETRTLLEVQGSEIIAKTCCNLPWDVIHAYNMTIINRLDVVIDTSYHVKADDMEDDILNCLYRQIHSAFAVNGSLGKMLTEGFWLWHYFRKAVAVCKNRKIKFGETAVPILQLNDETLAHVHSLCRENTTSFPIYYLASCDTMDKMALERIHLTSNERKIPRKSLARKVPRGTAPLAIDAETVAPIWHSLTARAELLGYSRPALATTADADIFLEANGRRLRPVASANGRYSFMLPAGSKALTLRSRATAPAEINPLSGDWRPLGVAVRGITLRAGDDHIVMPADHPGLTQGWHTVEKNAEGMWRWTSGTANLPLPAIASPMMLDIEITATATYVLAAAAADQRLAA
jgi:hypothetical protein